MKQRVPQYLHLPLQVLWFDTEDIMVMSVCYVVAVIFGSFTWFLLIVGPYLFVQLKRQKPRGFLRHLFLRWGLSQLDGYPTPYERRFRE